MPCSCWISSTSRVTAGGHVRVAVAVAADPGAEGQRPRGRRQVDAEPAAAWRRGRRAPAARRRRRGREVVDGVAGLVARVGPGHPQLVGLPQHVDQLGDPGVGPGGVVRVGPVQRGPGGQPRPARRRWPRSLVRIDRRAASVGWAVKTGRMASRRAAAAISSAGTPRSRDQAGGPVQPAALGGALPAQLPGPVHLLGDVGQVEVGGERAGQLGRGADVDLRRAGRRPPRRRCGPVRGPPRPGRAAPAPPGGPGSGRAGRPAGGCRRAGRRRSQSPSSRAYPFLGWTTWDGVVQP